MKKFCLYVLLLAVLLSFISCGKKTDENGFYQELDTAAVQAKKENKDIIIAITMKDDDMYSSAVIDNILKSESFKKEILAKYAVVHMDFSQSSYEKTVVNTEGSKKEQKASQEYADIMQRNSKLASLMNVQYTPSFYVFSKEKYFITALEYDDEIKNFEDFKTMLSNQNMYIEEMHKKIEATKKGSNQEKVAAIDDIYESVDLSYKVLFADLIEEVIKLDKNNESGLLSKYLLANADVKGSELYMSGDAVGAAQCYIKVCEEQYIQPEHKQQAYYMGAYILAMSGSNDYKAILDYLQLAIDAAPDSPQVASIETVLQYIKSSIAAMMAEAGDTLQ